MGKSTAVHFLNHVLGPHRRLMFGGWSNSFEGAVAAMGRLSPHHELALLEAGTEGPGTLRPILELARPTVGITTRVSTDHFSAFRTLEDTAREKAELARSLPPDGLCLLNADDERVRAMAPETRARVVLFGESPEAHYRAVDVADAGLAGVRFTVVHEGTSTPFAVPILGSHLVPSLLGAIACMHELGLPLATISEGAGSFRGIPHRCSLHQLSGGQIVIDDALKAPGGTVTAPFALLDAIPAPRKTIVIGHISDYGQSAKQMYRLACRAACDHADRIVMVAGRGKRIRPGVDTRPETELHVLEDWSALAELVRADPVPDEVILLKSSRTLHLERLLLEDLAPVDCRRAECRAVHPCDVCRNVYDPECRTVEKPPRLRRRSMPRVALPPPPPRV